MVADLGLGPEIWLGLTLLLSAAIFLSFRRPWSYRNLDLFLMFALVPGIRALVGVQGPDPWQPYVWLFIGTGLWLIRALVDLGLPRRPLLEPNLNPPGLVCLSLGMIALLLAETASLPLSVGAARNPAESSASRWEQDEVDIQGHSETAARTAPESSANGTGATLGSDGGVSASESGGGPLPVASEPGVVRWRSTKIILSRILAGICHLAIVVGLLMIGRGPFRRPIAGLSAAACYLVLPYARIEVVDSGQAFPAALIVGALLAYRNPALAGSAIGLASGWMPACIGLIPLWGGYYRGRHALEFFGSALPVMILCAAAGRYVPGIGLWAGALGARSFTQAGLVPGLEPPTSGSFWSGIDASYRIPVLAAYLCLVVVLAIWPREKNLGELISTSAAILLAGQFWYIDKGGTMVVLYLPLLLLMMFRPNLVALKPPRPWHTKPQDEPPSGTNGLS